MFHGGDGLARFTGSFDDLAGDSDGVLIEGIMPSIRVVEEHDTAVPVKFGEELRPCIRMQSLLEKTRLVPFLGSTPSPPSRLVIAVSSELALPGTPPVSPESCVHQTTRLLWALEARIVPSVALP